MIEKSYNRILNEDVLRHLLQRRVEVRHALSTSSERSHAYIRAVVAAEARFIGFRVVGAFRFTESHTLRVIDTYIAEHPPIPGTFGPASKQWLDAAVEALADELVMGEAL